MEAVAKPKKPWYKKWWVWVVIVLVLRAIGNAPGGVSPSTDSASVPSAPAVSTPVEPPAAVPAPAPAPAADPTAKIGQPLKVGDLVFTVSGATATTQLKSAFGNKSGNWVLITVTVKNESKEAVTTDSSFFKLLSADGSTYETDSDSLMYLSGDQNFFLEKINPNLSKTGQVLFAVPAGANPQDFTLQVQTGFWGTQTGGIALTE